MSMPAASIAAIRPSPRSRTSPQGPAASGGPGSRDGSAGPGAPAARGSGSAPRGRSSAFRRAFSRHPRFGGGRVQVVWTGREPRRSPIRPVVSGASAGWRSDCRHQVSRGGEPMDGVDEAIRRHPVCVARRSGPSLRRPGRCAELAAGPGCFLGAVRAGERTGHRRCDRGRRPHVRDRGERRPHVRGLGADSGRQSGHRRRLPLRLRRRPRPGRDRQHRHQGPGLQRPSDRVRLLRIGCGGALRGRNLAGSRWRSQRRRDHRSAPERAPDRARGGPRRERGHSVRRPRRPHLHEYRRQLLRDLGRRWRRQPRRRRRLAERRRARRPQPHLQGVPPASEPARGADHVRSDLHLPDRRSAQRRQGPRARWRGAGQLHAGAERPSDGSWPSNSHRFGHAVRGGVEDRLLRGVGLGERGLELADLGGPGNR